jgi:membrane dipeptidase
MRADVAAVLAEHPVVDGHNDLLWALRELCGYDFDAVDIGLRQTGRTHTDLPRLREGGVGAQFWSVYVPSRLGHAAVGATLEQVDAAYAMIERYADRLALATTADEVEAAWASGRIASLLGAEGGHQIDGSLAVLRMFQRLGVRYLTLTHNDNVPWADSATDARVIGGLSDFGREVVAEMNRIGMMVDLSHVSVETMRDALAASAAPVMFSHSSAYALCDHPRNVPDDVLAATAAGGGLCMVSFVPRFVNQANRDWALTAEEAARAAAIDPKELARFEPFLAGLGRRDPPPPATLDDVVAHVEHVREVAGIDHVGLGGDYDGVTTLPDGLEDVSCYPRLLEALADRGWSADDLARLTCRNLLRTMRSVEDAARGLETGHAAPRKLGSASSPPRPGA